jgi:PKHD-type hydroxylase
VLLQIADILSPENAANICDALAREGDYFTPGKTTAGWHAKAVKENEQSTGPAALKAVDMVKTTLSAHPVFESAARPKAFVKMLVSRYTPGMHYGRHVDNALMGGVRTDLSFTLFLSDPTSYDGGELRLEGHDGDTDVKLPAGGLVLYPTTQLHQVMEVTHGERLAIVGWVRSYIRNTEQRETLFELDQIVAHMRPRDLDRALLDQVFKVRNTLTRMWVED